MSGIDISFDELVAELESSVGCITEEKKELLKEYISTPEEKRSDFEKTLNPELAKEIVELYLALTTVCFNGIFAPEPPLKL
jgi:hypothetical protein